MRPQQLLAPSPPRRHVESGQLGILERLRGLCNGASKGGPRRRLWAVLKEGVLGVWVWGFSIIPQLYEEPWRLALVTIETSFHSMPGEVGRFEAVDATAACSFSEAYRVFALHSMGFTAPFSIQEISFILDTTSLLPSMPQPTAVLIFRKCRNPKSPEFSISWSNWRDGTKFESPDATDSAPQPLRLRVIVPLLILSSGQCGLEFESLGFTTCCWTGQSMRHSPDLQGNGLSKLQGCPACILTLRCLQLRGISPWQHECEGYEDPTEFYWNKNPYNPSHKPFPKSGNFETLHCWLSWKDWCRLLSATSSVLREGRFPIPVSSRFWLPVAVLGSWKG